MTALACDFGGRRIKLGVVRDGRVLAHDVIPAESDQPLVERLPVVADALLSLCRTCQIRLADCRGLSIAYPSVIDVPRARVVDEFGKFGDVSQLDLRAWCREYMQLPLFIDNDARMALFGEWQRGAGQGMSNVAMITLGTGLGAAAIIDNSSALPSRSTFNSRLATTSVSPSGPCGLAGSRSESHKERDLSGSGAGWPGGGRTSIRQYRPPNGSS